MKKQEIINKEIQKLRSHLNQDDMFLITMTNKGSETLTYKEAADALENETEKGMELIRSLENLNIDLIKRKQKPLWED